MLHGEGGTWPRVLAWPPCLSPFTVPGSVSPASLLGHSVSSWDALQGTRYLIYIHQNQETAELAMLVPSPS